MSVSIPSVAKLSRGTIIAFASGGAGEAIYAAMFNTFITIFYNQVVGLSNGLIGTAIMLALIGDAISDPVVGIMSDRWRSKHGRRHPFLFVAPIPLALSLYCIFNPPEFLTQGAEGVSQMGLFIWLAAWTISSRIFVTLYSVPHLALGGELTKDQHQRSRLFSTNTVVVYASGATFAFIAWSVFFAGERIRATDGELVPGHLDPAAYLPLVLMACAAIIISIWTCAITTYKHLPNLTEADESIQRLSPLTFAKQIISTFSNANYRVIIFGFFFFMIASGIYDTLGVFMQTYFWELKPEQIRWIGLVAIPSVMVGALSAPILMKKFDRKPVMISSIVGSAIFCQLVVDLRLMGLMPENGSPLLLPLLIANAACFIMSLGVVTVAVLSMIGDIVDENELLTGRRQEGLYYSARAFFTKASSSFGHFVAGVSLDLFVNLPFDAVPGEIEADVLTRLGILAGPVMGASAIISLSIYWRYNLTRERHQEILKALDEKKAEPAENI